MRAPLTEITQLITDKWKKNYSLHRYLNAAHAWTPNWENLLFVAVSLVKKFQGSTQMPRWLAKTKVRRTKEFNYFRYSVERQCSSPRSLTACHSKLLRLIKCESKTCNRFSQRTQPGTIQWMTLWRPIFGSSGLSSRYKTIGRSPRSWFSNLLW